MRSLSGTFGQSLQKPYYVFRPAQLIRRIVRAAREIPDETDIRVPWGVSIRCSPREEIGRALWTTGVYEIAVTETIWRLTDRGDVAVDAGANLGYMTSVMATRVGPTGTVLAFEPHPAVHAMLLRNVSAWRRTLGWSHIELSRTALSSRSGTGSLYMSALFERNRGTASLARRSAESDVVEVPLQTLDDLFRDGRPIGVLKIDVEGHEPDVLRGAERLLEKRLIRDLVFEACGDPGPAVSLLRRHDYHVFRLWRELSKPTLRPAESIVSSRWEPPSYIATCSPSRCTARFKAFGWQCLRTRTGGG
jgi:FkbM family methyltransferase